MGNTTVTSGPSAVTATSGNSTALTFTTETEAGGETGVEVSVLRQAHDWIWKRWNPAIDDFATLLRHMDIAKPVKPSRVCRIARTALVERCADAFRRESFPEGDSTLPGQETISHLADIIYVANDVKMFEYGTTQEKTNCDKGQLLGGLRSTRYGPTLADKKSKVRLALKELVSLLENKGLRTAVDGAIASKYGVPDSNRPLKSVQSEGSSYRADPSIPGTQGPTNATVQSGSGDYGVDDPADPVIQPSISQGELSSTHQNDQALSDNEWRQIQLPLSDVLDTAREIYVRMKDVKKSKSDRAESVRDSFVTALAPFLTVHDDDRASVADLVNLFQAFWPNSEEAFDRAEVCSEIQAIIFHYLAEPTSVESMQNIAA